MKGAQWPGFTWPREFEACVCASRRALAKAPRPGFPANPGLGSRQAAMPGKEACTADSRASAPKGSRELKKGCMCAWKLMGKAAAYAPCRHSAALGLSSAASQHDCIRHHAVLKPLAFVVMALGSSIPAHSTNCDCRAAHGRVNLGIHQLNKSITPFSACMHLMGGAFGGQLISIADARSKCIAGVSRVSQNFQLGQGQC